MTIILSPTIFSTTNVWAQRILLLGRKVCAHVDSYKKQVGHPTPFLCVQRCKA